MLLLRKPPDGAALASRCRARRQRGLSTRCTVVDTEPTPGAAQGRRTVTLRTKEARQTLRFVEGRVGANKVVLIEAVATGSQAFAAGVRPGDKVIAFSDPVRDAVLWTLSANDASLRFIKDALRLRISPELTIVLEPLEDAEAAVEAQQDVNRQRALAELSRSQPKEEDGEDAAEDEDAEAPLVPPPWSGGLPTVSQRRNAKRQERLEEVGKRNDSLFFSALLAGVLATPVIILVLTYTQGWLEPTR